MNSLDKIIQIIQILFGTDFIQDRYIFLISFKRKRGNIIKFN